MTDMTIRNPVDAFESAIRAGVLSNDEEDLRFAGNFMYMCTNDDETYMAQRDYFKNIETREYISAPVTAE